MRKDRPPLRGALIGCGFVSRHHLEGWSRIPEARLVALCDRNPDALALGRAQIPLARRYTDAESLFRAEASEQSGEENRLDFVEVCTGPEAHRELVELASGFGVHILCQKPAAPTREDLTAMIQAGESAGVRVMIHENWRFRPWYRALRAELAHGTIGRPIRIRIAHRDTRALRLDGFDDQPYFRTMPRLILFEMGCHLIDTARYLMGEVTQVSASLKRFGVGHQGEDVATVLLDFEGGAMGLVDISWCAPAEYARSEWALNETVVEGTEGALRVLLDGSLERIGQSGQRETIKVNLPAAQDVHVDGYVATQRHFIHGLLTDEPHETSATDTLRTMDVVWRAYESAEHGTRLAI